MRGVPDQAPDKEAMPSSTPSGDPVTKADEALSRGRRDRVERLAPLELAEWLEARVDSVAERWTEAIAERSAGRTVLLDRVAPRFTALLVRFLPWMLGPYRETIEPLWIRASELFGQVAARRRLAAGEVIEEFQVLREAVIRLMWADPPAVNSSRTALREALRLNRILDRGVTQASVGHTDALFFALFQGSGVPEHLTDDVRYELRNQLQAIRKELDILVRAVALR